jgi:hypothetical protein
MRTGMAKQGLGKRIGTRVLKRDSAGILGIGRNAARPAIGRHLSCSAPTPDALEY